MISMPEFWASVAAKQAFLSTLWELPGFCLSMVKCDFMHISCLGILQYLQGNVFWELFRSVGGTFKKPDRACTVLLNIMNCSARALGVECPVSWITVSMIRGSATDKPKFKAKAAEGRHLLPILRHSLEHAFDLDTPHEKSRFRCVAALNSVYEEMINWDNVHSPDRLRKFARQHLILFRDLSSKSTDPYCWCMFPKHHLFCHVTDTVTTNPRLEWNYSEEAAIFEGVLLAQQTNVHAIPTQVIERHRVTFRLDVE